jgi:hypothetical protein
MAKVRSKGTAWAVSIASVFTVIGQALSIDKDEMKSEDYESDTLDNADAGIPYDLTGRSEGGSISAELFFDPLLACHTYMLGLITTPAKSNHQLTFANSSLTVWTFSAASVSFTGPKFALKEGVKATVKVKLDGLPTFPGSSSSA